MKRLPGLPLILVLILAVGSSCSVSFYYQPPVPVPSREPSAEAVTGPQPAETRKVDLTPRPLECIPVGTVIGKKPPAGWSNLVLFAVPTLTAEDEAAAPKIAAHYAQMFKFTVLANVARRAPPDRGPFYLEKVARGFATTVDEKEKIINGRRTLGAKLGLFGRMILEENEKILDEDVRQVVRTDTLLVFDAQAVMLRGDEHCKMIVRHALLVEPRTGRLYTLVWLLTEDYAAAEDAIQLLPDGMWEKRLLSVKRDRFTAGIPSRDAFALRQIPQGTPVPYTPELKRAATVKTFDEALVSQVEATLRAAAVKASSR